MGLAIKRVICLFLLLLAVEPAPAQVADISSPVTDTSAALPEPQATGDQPPTVSAEPQAQGTSTDSSSSTSSQNEAVDPEAVVARADPFEKSGGHVSGNAAVARLGVQLPVVARNYGMSSEKLTNTLATDPDLLVDGNLDLVYKCSMLDVSDAPLNGGSVPDHHHHHHHRKLAQVNAEASDPAIGTLQNSSTGVPLLHSRPGANLVIYLDFDGHTATGTLWNSNNGSNWACSAAGTCGTITSPPFNSQYDTTGTLLPFVDIEKRMIVSIRVVCTLHTYSQPL